LKNVISNNTARLRNPYKTEW